MRLEDLHFLLSPLGRRLLEELAEEPVTPETHLKLASRLRARIGPQRAHAVLETATLRQRARAKFSRAADMFFTDLALQQASAETVANYRAQRYLNAEFSLVADLGCGIGGDSLALAAKMKVLAVDNDLLNLAMARENLRAYRRAENFQPVQADLAQLGPVAVEALFADPSRRDEQGRRRYSVADYRPPLGLFQNWCRLVPHQGIKIGPGVNYAEVPPEPEVEFISLHGEVREAVLWFGRLRSEARRRATLLPGLHTMTDVPVEPVPVVRPRRYLYEPDGAVIRAHLVEQLAQSLDACKIDPDIAYLTSDRFRATSFARCYVLEDTLPFQLKRLRHYLRQRHVGQVTIKKRGSPLDPDVLRQQLRLSGEPEHRIIFLTHVKGKAMALIGREHDQ